MRLRSPSARFGFEYVNTYGACFALAAAADKVCAPAQQQVRSFWQLDKVCAAGTAASQIVLAIGLLLPLAAAARRPPAPKTPGCTSVCQATTINCTSVCQAPTIKVVAWHTLVQPLCGSPPLGHGHTCVIYTDHEHLIETSKRNTILNLWNMFI
jgi:hypothetical protein